MVSYIYDKMSFATLVKKSIFLNIFVLIFNRFLCNSALNLILLNEIDLNVKPHLHCASFKTVWALSFVAVW